MAHDIALAIHIVAGAAALVVGPVALLDLLRGGGWSHRLTAYRIAVVVVAAAGVALAILDWERLWWLAIIAVAVAAAVVLGGRLAGGEGPSAPAWSVRLIWGTYIGLVTGLLVVSWGSPLAWILPTVVGVPLVERAAAAAGTRERSPFVVRAK